MKEFKEFVERNRRTLVVSVVLVFFVFVLVSLTACGEQVEPGSPAGNSKITECQQLGAGWYEDRYGEIRCTTGGRDGG